jgi:hypothetical protein
MTFDELTMDVRMRRKGGIRSQNRKAEKLKSRFKFLRCELRKLRGGADFSSLSFTLILFFKMDDI